MFALLGFSNLVRLENYVKDMQAISHDYVLMGLQFKTDEEYAGHGITCRPRLAPTAAPKSPPRPRLALNAGRMSKPAGRKKRGASGLDLPDENFDYDDFVKREFGGKSPVPRGVSLVLVGSRAGAGGGFHHVLAAMSG